MNRCHRCSIVYLWSTFGDFCPDCAYWLDRQGAVEYDEGRVLGFAEVCGWAGHGRLPAPLPRWECKQPRYDQ